MMIYECKNPIIQIKSVEKMNWAKDSFEIAPRAYCAIAFRIHGTATIEVDKKPYFVNTGDVLYLPQGIPYTAEYSDTELIVIHFETVTNDKVPEVYHCTNKEEIFKAFLSAYVFWKEKAPGYEAHVYCQLYYILAELNRSEITNHMPNHFTNAVAYINGNYTDPALTVDNICKNAGISTTGLRQLFRKYYQKTPTEYITNLRLEWARNLISCGISIEQAAERSGFNDSKYFARLVKKQFHCTPRELKSYGR